MHGRYVDCSIYANENELNLNTLISAEVALRQKPPSHGAQTYFTLGSSQQVTMTFILVCKMAAKGCVYLCHVSFRALIKFFVLYCYEEQLTNEIIRHWYSAGRK